MVKRFQEKALDLAQSLVRDQHLAEDAVQQGFLIAFCHLNQLRNDAAFPGWFRQIIRTEALRIAQKNSICSDVFEQYHSHDSLPIENLDLQELREIIHRSLSKLSKANQQTTKAYLDEQSCDEIAGTLGVPSGTVRRRLHQARNQLRSMLKGYYDESLEEKKRTHKQDYGIPL